MTRGEFDDKHRQRDPEEWERLYAEVECDMERYREEGNHPLLDAHDSEGWPEGTFHDSDGRTMDLAQMLYEARVARAEVAMLEHLWSLPCRG